MGECEIQNPEYKNGEKTIMANNDTYSCDPLQKEQYEQNLTKVRSPRATTDEGKQRRTKTTNK
eukprot:12190014-Prorocentrum_lima.AAC.1